MAWPWSGGGGGGGGGGGVAGHVVLVAVATLAVQGALACIGQAFWQTCGVDWGPPRPPPQRALLVVGTVLAALLPLLLLARRAGAVASQQHGVRLQSTTLQSLPPKFLVRPLAAVWMALYRALHAVLPPELRLRQAASLFWISDSLYHAARLRVADALLQGPRTAAQLAKVLPEPVDARNLHRLLRFLAAHRLFGYDADSGEFSLTPTSALLCEAHQVPELPLVLAMNDQEDHRIGWNNLALALRNGGSAFDQAMGKTMWEHYDQNPELSQRADAMFAAGFLLDSAFLARDYSKWSSFRSVVDVGGGSGTFLKEVVTVWPHLRGCVSVLDRPAVVKAAAGGAAEAAGVSFVPGSFFDKVEPVGADAYTLKHILHDWDDDTAARILANVTAAMPPAAAGARLLVIDAVIEGPDDPVDMLKTGLDMQMMAMCTGTERTVTEWRSLLAAAGLEIVQIVRTRSFASIIEARKTSD
eukprot:SM000030S11412  [mRNA]  locus=s30:560613:562966:- [translate_table: standard]